jgi:hypothetical protein
MCGDCKAVLRKEICEPFGDLFPSRRTSSDLWNGSLRADKTTKRRPNFVQTAEVCNCKQAISLFLHLHFALGFLADWGSTTTVRHVG